MQKLHGLTHEQALRNFVVMDVGGVIGSGRRGVDRAAAPFARPVRCTWPRARAARCSRQSVASHILLRAGYSRWVKLGASGGSVQGT